MLLSNFFCPIFFPKLSAAALYTRTLLNNYKEDGAEIAMCYCLLCKQGFVQK